MNKSLIFSKVLVLAGILTLTVSARADWTGAAGDGIYGNPDNWSSGIINHRVINLDTNPALKFSNVYNTFTVSDGMVFTTTSAIDMNFWERNGVSSGTFTFTGNAPAAITMDLGVNTGTGQAKAFYFGRSDMNLVLDYGGRDAIFNLSPSLTTPINNGNFVDTMYLAAAGSNIGSLTKTGAGSLIIRGKNTHTFTVSGPVTVSGGLLSIVQGSEGYGQVPLTTPRIIGATEYNIIGQGSALFLHNGGNFDTGLTYTQNLIETSSTITLYSAQFGAGANSAQSVNQSVAKVVLADGRNVIGTNNTSNIPAGSPFTLTIGELVRQNYATLNIIGNLGSTAANGTLIKVTNDTAILSALVGGDGAGGSVNISILPWATARSGLDSTWNNNWNTTGNAQYIGTSFVTYDPTLGFRALNLTTEYFQTGSNANAISASGSTNNVRAVGGIGTTGVATNNIITADQTVNALLLDGWDTAIGLQNNATLTVASGALMGAGGRLLIGGGNATFRSGTISSGANPFVLNQAGMEFYIPLINTVSGNQPGMIVDTNSATVFNVANNYGGTTLIHGSLTVKNSGAIPRASAVHVDSYGLLTISATNNTGIKVTTPSLTGSGTVNFEGNTTVANPNQLNVGTGDFSTVTANNSVNIGTGGVLAPGEDSGLLQTGTLFLSSSVASMNFLAGATLSLDIAGNGLSDTLAFTNSAATLNFAAGATIALNFLDGYTPADGDTWLLATGFNLAGSSLPNLGDLTISGLPADAFDLQLTAAGLQLTALVTIPEPSAWALLLTGVALTVAVSRRVKVSARRAKRR